MPTNILQTLGMSNAQLPLPLFGSSFATRAQITAPGGPPPTPDHIAGGGGTTLVYPRDPGKYYIQFSLAKYHRDTLDSVGTLNNQQTIVMPLSELMLDDLQVKWQETPIGLLTGTVFSIGSAVINSVAPPAPISQGTSSQSAAPTTNSKFGDFITGLKASASAIPGHVGEAAGALQGFSPNQFLTMLFVGPEYKRHQFSWNLSPNTQDESANLANIINAFKIGMSPTREYGVLWGYPMIFSITIFAGGAPSQYMYSFKPAVCESFGSNYTPAGRGAFYHKTMAPEGVQIKANFVELEYWVRNQTGDGFE